MVYEENTKLFYEAKDEIVINNVIAGVLFLVILLLQLCPTASTGKDFTSCGNTGSIQRELLLKCCFEKKDQVK